MLDLYSRVYHRGGTLSYFAGYDIHHARVLGLCTPKTGIQPLNTSSSKS